VDIREYFSGFVGERVFDGAADARRGTPFQQSVPLKDGQMDQRQTIVNESMIGNLDGRSWVC
jgi:hypothetical protein